VATSAFREALRAAQPRGEHRRRWLFVPYDQLGELGPLAREPADELGIVVIENPWKAARRPYHRQKLVAVLANLRHFALEQARRGVAVKHVVADGPYRDALAALSALGPIRCMEPAERELRVDLAPLVASGAIELMPHEGWLTTPDDFAASQPRPPYRMDRFYRHVRRRTGLLMERGKPVGGKLSFDAENRERWPGTPPAPALPRFEPDAITREVAALVAARFPDHPGAIELAHLPATAEDARRHWAWAREHCLPLFGPYEDAMSVRERTLFHSRTSMLINLGRLSPAALVRDVAAMAIPLPSKEGFIRQVLGWREFMHHVHVATDGFRTLAGADDTPRDGGYATWKGAAWPVQPDDSATPSELGADAPLPPVYWGVESGLTCVDTVVKSVWDEGYSHHITRLMVLANLASLLDVSPRQLTDWFWVAYTDAYDWVVEPNVLAMGTWAVGDLVVTKPYVASANYINNQSDYCRGCAFDPKRDCPLTSLYWAFFERHRAALSANPRLFRVYQMLAKRSADQRRADAAAMLRVRATLARGERLAPAPQLPLLR
jgi:deoxyribodipyrimidine photolyase-related protein